MFYGFIFHFDPNKGLIKPAHIYFIESDLLISFVTYIVLTIFRTFYRKTVLVSHGFMKESV